MSDFDGYLDAAEVSIVAEAFSDAGLSHQSILAKMLSGNTDSAAIGLIDTKLSGTAELASIVLQYFNAIQNLPNGSVPLEQLLVDAVDQTNAGPNLNVFEQALLRVQRGTEVERVQRTNSTRTLRGPDMSGSASGATILSRGGDPLHRGPGFTNIASTINTHFEEEAEIGAADETLAVNFLNSGALSAESVFKILIHHHIDGTPVFDAGDKPRVSSGTGWVIAKGIVITNHHVVDARGVGEPDADAIDFQLQGESANVHFDFINKDNEPKGVVLEPGCVLAFDKKLDYCLLRLPAELHERAFLKLRSHGIQKRIDRPLRERVNVLQHPQGRPMRLGFRTNYVVEGTKDTLAYLTDTARGSSGSPVCDDSWAVAALHLGADVFENSGIEIMGRPIKRKNVGTPIPTIMQHLKEKFADVYDEITQSQSDLD